MRKLEVNVEMMLGTTPEFCDVVVEMSDCPFEFIKGNLKARYLEEACKKQTKKSFTRIRSFSIEKSETIKKEADFYNKSIFEMSKKDLRDFCCEFCYMNIDTEKQSLDNIQNKTAEEWLKRKYGYKEMKDTAFYKYNASNNSYYIDYNKMRSEEAKPLFVVKTEYKPIEKVLMNDSKIDLQTMLEKINNNKKLEKEDKKKNKVEDNSGSDLDNIKK